MHVLIITFCARIKNVMRSLEEVLKDLNAAEKEFKEKCEKYDINEKKDNDKEKEG